jgi:predicted alpha/beta hydrolase family esterase
MQFVVFHGSFGNPQENWIPFLKENLVRDENNILIPQMPVDVWKNIIEKGRGYTSPTQNVQNWLQTFEKEILPNLQKENVVFVGHSIASLFILHVVNHFNLSLQKAIFVSPFLSVLPRWEFTTVNGTFYKTDFDFVKTQNLIEKRIAVFSDNDPYVPQEKFEEFVNLTKSEPILIKNGGHLNSDAGFITFPKLLELCQN